MSGKNVRKKISVKYISGYMAMEHGGNTCGGNMEEIWTILSGHVEDQSIAALDISIESGMFGEGSQTFYPT